MGSVGISFEIPTRRIRIEKVGLMFRNLKCENNKLDNNAAIMDDKLDESFLVDINYLKSLDPRNWKNQDHYAVLGLQELRINASDDDVKRAYRKMVLQHHPDKRKAKGEDVQQEDDYFTCIKRAYEILGTLKRRSYDSIDPLFDDSLPLQSDIEKDFYGTFQKYFELNSRWSERKRVPAFGDDNAKREDVDEFYRFWYDFKSWREFSYLDEEDKERGQDRDERRWIEKENKAARIKRKKEEMLRIRTLVDLAYNNDKRIQRFKNEEKEKKLAIKKAKIDAAQALKAEQERAVREVQLAKERAERAEQQRIEQLRMEKEQMKKSLKRERKLLRDRAKENKYFVSHDDELLKHMEGVERICETYSLDELQALNKELELELVLEPQGREAFFVALETARTRIQARIEEANSATLKKASKSDIKQENKKDTWNQDTTQLLIKAVNLFPAGTNQRWDIIATFINQHSNNSCNFSARDILNKAKALQSSDFSKNALKSQANEAAFQCFEKNRKEVKANCGDITINSDIKANGPNKIPTSTSTSTSTPVPTPTLIASSTPMPTMMMTTNPREMNGTVNGDGGNRMTTMTMATSATTATTTLPTITTMTTTTTTSTATATTTKPIVIAKAWNKEEQLLLEQAIKSYPISTPDRWDRIAECIPNRSKKDCLKRVKELVELINMKKEAQQAIK